MKAHLNKVVVRDIGHRTPDVVFNFIGIYGSYIRNFVPGR